MLTSVLSTSGKEQNMHYPPYIFDAHYNAVTNWLLDELAKQWSGNQSIRDIGRPFLLSQEERVVNGEVTLPKEYRNLLGVGITVTEDFSKDCGCLGKTEEIFENDPLAPTPDQIRMKRERTKCISHELTMVDIGEFNKRSTHSYKKPTLKKAIGVQKDANKIKVCPFDLSYVELRMFRIPKVYRFGYKNNGDDTYSFDSKTSEESEWTDNAVQYLLKGLNTLYSMYTKDQEMRDWNLELKKLGVF